MPPTRSESKAWVKHVTALFILMILRDSSTYGNKIADEIKRVTGHLVVLNPNFLYPQLRAMEGQGYVTACWDNPSTRSKRIYTITEQGTAHLEVLKAQVRERYLEIERKQEAIRSCLFKD